MDAFPPLPPHGLVAAAAPGNAPVVLDEMPEVASPPLNVVPLASSDENVVLMAPNDVDDVQDHSSFDLVAQMPAAVLLGEFDEAASSSDSVAQVTQGVRGVSPVNARGAPVLDNARVVREAGPVSARAVSAPLSARGVREAEPVVDLQACSQTINHQRTMLDVGTFLENNGLSMNDFVKFQSAKYARNMDDFGVVKTNSLESLKNNFEVQNGVLRICSDDPVEMEVEVEVVCLPAYNAPPSCPQATVMESPKNKRKKGKARGQNGPFFTESPQVSPPLASPSKRGKNVDEDGFTQVENKRSLRSRGKVTTSNNSQ
ncbi:hypothetical protein ACET3Z_013106 [Daucus carota]